MKKYFAILCAAVALVACNKNNEIVIPEEDGQDLREVTFNFTVNQASDTKAKTDWADGDVVYIFFKNIEEKFVKMSFDGADWTTVASPEPFVASDFSGIADEDKKLTAIHFPSFVNAVSVYYDDENDIFTFLDNAGEKIYTYYMYASPVSYTVEDPAEVHAGITMIKPANFVQFFVPMEAEELALNHGYRFVESHLQPIACKSVALDGSINIDDTRSAGYSLKGYRTTNNVAGIMFSGYLSTAGSPTAYNFNLVTNKSEEKPYALGTQTIGGTKTINSGVIFNLPITSNTAEGYWSALEPWVDLGLASGTKWATGNLDATAGTTKIADPEAEGQFFMWGATAGQSWNEIAFDPAFIPAPEICPYYVDRVYNDTKSTWEYRFNKYKIRAAYSIGDLDNKWVLDDGDNAAIQITGGRYTIPDQSQCNELAGAYSGGVRTGGIPIKWRSIAQGYTIPGYLMTGNNGIILFLSAPGQTTNSGTERSNYGDGFYWSRTIYADSQYAKIIQLNSTWMGFGNIHLRFTGHTIRPVLN